MAVTLAEMSKVQQDPLKKAVLEDMLRLSQPLRIVPIETVPGTQIKQTRWQTLPSSGVRKIGGSWTESTGKLEQITETLYIYGGEVKVDRVLLKDKTVIENPLTTQLKMKAAALTADFANDLISGDHAVDPDRFEGLKKRISNLDARYTIKLAATDAFDVFASDANEHSFIDKLIEAIYITKANALLMNEKTLLGLGRVLRRASNLLATTQDAYNRSWTEFNGAKLVDIGLKGDQATEIITNTEDPGDAGNDSTSIYAVRFDGSDGLRVIQLNGTSPAPYDPSPGGELETAPAVIRRIDWVVGLQLLGKHAVARVQNFKLA